MEDILARLTWAGHQAVIVSGAVRDAILALRAGMPSASQDVDIATSATPQEIKRLFCDRPVLTVGEAFGVVGARLAEPPSSP